MAEPYELTTDECVHLLRSGVVGRIAVVTPQGPHIVPVNYSVVDDVIVLRTTPHSVVGTYGLGAQVAFEVDHFDHEYWLGWSVLARGRSEPIADAEEVRRIHRTWAPHPWASGQRNVYIGLRWTDLTGRRLGPRARTRGLPTERQVSGL